MAASKQLADLNAALARAPCAGKYDLLVTLADQSFHLQTDGSCLKVARASASRDARGKVAIDSVETLAKLEGGGTRTIMSMLAQGKMQIEGDNSQLEEMAREFAPHAAALRGPAAQLLLGDQARWVQDCAAPSCMAPHCGKAFRLLRRRHHCRSCGKVFCGRCAPLEWCCTAAGRTQQRTCVMCASGEAAPEAMGAAPDTWAPSSGGPQGGDVGQWCLELQIESALRWISFWAWATTLASVAAAGYLLYLFPPTTQLSAGVLGMVALVGYWERQMWQRYLAVVWVCVVIGLFCLVAGFNSKGRCERAQSAEWAACNRICARFIFDCVVEKGGFWVKVAQTISATPMMPDAYCEELAKLQDAMPSDPQPVVEATLAEALGADWAAKVRLYPRPPLGSATIGQVHQAKLTVRDESGALKEVEGVVKVQHPDLKRRLDIDIRASNLLGRLFSIMFPTLFKDLPAILKEVGRITKAELDFTTEAMNQLAAAESLSSSGLDVTVPKVIRSLVTPKVLGMEFVDGIKISDFALTASREERQRVLKTLIEYYGYTLHGPIFNFDPHPGNILIEKATGSLCMLDWGQARHKTPAECVSWARFFMGADTMDQALFARGIRELDDQTEGTNVSIMMTTLRFLLKDSRSAQQTREEFAQANSTLEGIEEVCDTNTDALYQGPFISVSKTALLLYDISTKLGVSMPLLHTIATSGYRLLLAENGFGEVSVHQTPTSWVLSLPQQPSVPRPLRRAPLQTRMENLLWRLHGEGAILGAQLAVLDAQTGECLADVALGHTSWTRPVPVERDTPFNIWDLSKLYLGLAVLRLVDSGGIALSHIVARPPAVQGKSGEPDEVVTLEHVLSHTSGMFRTLPAFIESREDLYDLEANTDRIEQDPPLLRPGRRQIYAATSYGWLLARACKMAGTDLKAVWSSFANASLGMGRGQDLALTMPCGTVAEVNKDGVGMNLQQFARQANAGLQIVSCLVKSNDPKSTVEERAHGLNIRSAMYKETWLETDEEFPPSARSSILPGLKAYTTARAAAEALHAAAAGRSLGSATLSDALYSRWIRGEPIADAMMALDVGYWQQEFASSVFGLGIELDPLRRPGTCPSVPSNPKELIWGGTSTTGSFALAIPGCRPLVAAFLVNRTHTYDATRRVKEELVKAAAQVG